MNDSRNLYLGLILCAVLSIHGCDLIHGISDDQSGASASPSKLERRIEEHAREWFSHTKSASQIPRELAEFLSLTGVELRLSDETIRGRKSLLDWAARRNREFSRVNLEIGPIEFIQEEQGKFRARFDVDRRGWDKTGLLHISRTHHVWRLRIDHRNALVLLEAEESLALPHLGTGTRILCL